MTDEQTTNDPAFLQLAADIIRQAQETNDPRILAMASAACQQVAESGLLPTILLQYGALLERETELMAEIEEDQQTIDMARRAAS